MHLRADRDVSTRRLCLFPFALFLALAGCTGVATHARTTGSDAATVVVRDVSVVDVLSGRVLPHRSVAIAGDRIAAVGPADGIGIPATARVIDGRGRFLIPGLWDMHAHVLWSDAAMRTGLPAYVANGVTGIRDMGGTLPVLAAFHASMQRDAPAWPRVVAAGAILDGPDPVQADVSIGVADAASARTAVDTLADAGADFIKVYTLVPRDAYFAIIDEAHRRGLPVAGHLPASVTVEEAVRSGQRSIEHLRDEIEPFCHGDDVAACTRLAALFREHGTWQVPTLVVLRSKAMFDDPKLADDPRLRYLPESLRDEWSASREAKIARGSDYAAGKRAQYAEERRLTGFFARERVPLLAGTDSDNADSYPGFSLHDELGLLVEAGLSPLDALRAATLWPADSLQARATTGTIEPGRDANLVLLDANPLRDIAATRRIDAVVLRGRVLDRKALDGMLANVAADAAH